MDEQVGFGTWWRFYNAVHENSVGQFRYGITIAATDDLGNSEVVPYGQKALKKGWTSEWPIPSNQSQGLSAVGVRRVGNHS
jgi:hypothetical protein